MSSVPSVHDGCSVGQFDPHLSVNRAILSWMPSLVARSILNAVDDSYGTSVCISTSSILLVFSNIEISHTCATYADLHVRDLPLTTLRSLSGKQALRQVDMATDSSGDRTVALKRRGSCQLAVHF